MSKSIQETFAGLHEKKQIALMPFISAGYPSMEATVAVMPALEAGGANLIEIGFPFSDPIADGPTIQESYTIALAKKVRVAEIFAAVKKARPTVGIPLVGMVSVSIVVRMGPEKFFAAAKDAGFNAILIPDLPPPEVQKTCEQIRAAGLDTVLMIAPTTSPERRKEIADLCSGFVYYLSISGITGARDELPSDLPENLRQLKSITDRPVCVGFGISKPRHVKSLVGLADGAIVGSAVVRRMTDHAKESPAKIGEVLKSYCAELLSESR